MKLNAKRCGAVGEGKPPRWFALPDEPACHLWSSEPTNEITELGPIAWWVCGRCPARVLHDPETEDGFPEEPIVVYPPPCFDPPARCGYQGKGGEKFGFCCLREAGHGGEHCPLDGCDDHPEPGGCGCPRKASGAVVHLEGCLLDEVQLESAALMAERFATPIAEGRGSKRAVDGDRDTEPGPPSEELKRAMAEAACPNCNEQLELEPGGAHCDQCGWEPAGLPLDEEDIPTARYPAHIESAASIFERVEHLFGRPPVRDEPALPHREELLERIELVQVREDALGGIEG